MSRAGRHRTRGLVDGAVGPSHAAADVQARLLGQHPSMGPRDLSAKASLSLRSVRAFWAALGLAKVADEEAGFVDADLVALNTVAALVRDGTLDEPSALAMTRALARATDRLALWQTQHVVEALSERERAAGADQLPGPAVARAAAVKLADLSDDLELLLIHAWRRHLAAAVSGLVSDRGDGGDQSDHGDGGQDRGGTGP